MKKKLALLMAVVMLVGAALPLNLLAYTTNSLRPAGQMRYYGDNTVMIDARAGQQVYQYQSNSGRLSTNARANIWGAAYTDYISPLLANDGYGIDLVMRITEKPTAEMIAQAEYQGFYEFQVRLTNAEWAFVNGTVADPAVRGNDGGIVDNSAAATDYIGTATYGRYLEPIYGGTGWIGDLRTTGSRDSLPTDGTDGDMLADKTPGSAFDVTQAAILAGLDAVNDEISSYDHYSDFTDEMDALRFSGLQDIFTGVANALIDSSWPMRNGVFVNIIMAEREAMKAVALDTFAALFNGNKISNVDTYATLLDNDNLLGTALDVQRPDLNTALDTFADLAGAINDLYWNPAAAGPLFFENPMVISAAIQEAYEDATTGDALALLNKLNGGGNYFTAFTAGASGTLPGDDYSGDAGRDTFDISGNFSIFTNITTGDRFLWSGVVQSVYQANNEDNLITEVENFALMDIIKQMQDAVNLAATYVGNYDLIGLIGDDGPNEAPRVALVKGMFAAMLADFNAMYNTDAAYQLLVNPNAQTNPTFGGTGLYNKKLSNANFALDMFTTAGDTAGFAENNGEYYNEVYNYALETFGGGMPIGYEIEVTGDSGEIITVRIDLEDLRNIQIGDIILIPMIIMTWDASQPVTYTIWDNRNLVQGGTYTLGTTGTSIGTTSTTFSSVVNAAKGRIYLSSLTITENTPNVLKNGYFIIVPPAEYSMVYNPLTGISFSWALTDNGRLTPTVSNAGLININQSGTTRQALLLQISGLRDEQRLYTGSFSFNGLAMTPLTNDLDMVTNIGQELSVVIYGVNSFNSWVANTGSVTGITGTGVSTATNAKGQVALANSGITAESKVVARRDLWSISYTAADAVERFSGLTNQSTATVSIKELTRDSWMARKDTIFTVVDEEGNEIPEVKITRVAARSLNMFTVGVTTAGGTTNTPFGLYNTLSTGYDPRVFWNSDVNGSGRALTGAPYKYSNVSFSRTGQEFRITDIYTSASSTTITTGALASLDLTFYLSAAASFEGAVYIQISGPAISDNTYNELNATRVQVATFYKPVSIDTTMTELQIGWQKYDVADIVINEVLINGVGSLTAGTRVRVALGEGGNGRLTEYMYFNAVQRGDVYASSSDPNFTISETNVVNIFNNSTKYKALEFTVMRKSSSIGAQVTLKNLSLNVDRTVPEGKYDILVSSNPATGGAALVNNNINDTDTYLYLYDRFDVWGVVYPGYVNMRTEGANPQVKNKIELTAGTTTYLKNGVEAELEVTTLNVDGRFYVPVRFVATALGIPDANITYNDGTQKVQIWTSDYKMQIVFQKDSASYWVNGVEYSMLENGVEAKAIIDPVTERFYLPVRFLAYALNIPVDYYTNDSGQVVAVLNYE